MNLFVMKREDAILYCDRAILVCLCLLFFCLPFARAGVETFTWLALFLWILKRVLGYRSGALWGMLPETELNKVLGVFIAANAISTIFTVNFALSSRGFFGKELKFMAIYFMLVETINSKERLKNLLTVIIASAVLIVADAAVQYFRGVDFLKGYPLARLVASFSSANDFAGWLIVIIPLFLGILMVDKTTGRKLKALLSLLIIILLICLLMTYTRAAWVGFIIGFFLMAYYTIKNYTLKIRILCLSVSICLLGIFLFLPQPVKGKIKAIGHINFNFGQTINERIKSIAKIKEGSILIRSMLWKESLMIIRDYPLTGCGLNTYSIVARHYKIAEGGGVYPHNSFLQMTAETGLLGLFAFLWVLFIFFKMGLQYLNKKRSPLLLGLLAGVLAFLVQSFFDTHLYALQSVVLFWFMMGLAVAVMRLELDMSK